MGLPRYDEVSIHALLAECDFLFNSSIYWSSLFQSTHSLRSATGFEEFSYICLLFQSTHSLRSATMIPRFPLYRERVSIHALLAECDLFCGQSCAVGDSFNPRTPCGVRPLLTSSRICTRKVSIHALLAECDFQGLQGQGQRQTFQSTHSLRSATIYQNGAVDRRDSFNPRTPCGVRLRPTLYIATQQSKSYFAPTSLKRPSLHGCSF